MKKGFTLIELLAVILILGIIALIAIPTVSNILKEARGGAFNATVEQVVKSVENNCQLEKVDNQDVTNVYVINNGKIKPKIDIKGSLPDNGIIYVNDNCAVTLGIDDNKHNASKDLNNDNIVYNDCTSNSCASKEHLLYTEVLSKIENAVNTWKEEFPGEMPPNGKTYKITLAYFKKRGFIDSEFRNPINNLCIADDKDVEITNNNGKMEVYFNTYDNQSNELYCSNSIPMTRDVVIKSDDVVEYNVGDTFTAPDFTVFNVNGTIENKSKVTVSYRDSNGNTVSQIDMSRPGKWRVNYSYTYSESSFPAILMRRTINVIVK